MAPMELAGVLWEYNPGRVDPPVRELVDFVNLRCMSFGGLSLFVS